MCTGSFYRWRELLLKDSESDMAAVVADPVSTIATRTATASSGKADFVDLGTLGDLAPSARRNDTASSRVELRLELGGGLVLHLVRG